MDRRVMTWLTVIAATVLVILIAAFWKPLFGPGTWGSGGNMVAWALCGGLGFLWANVIQKERHLRAISREHRHHKDRMEQAERHHKEQMAVARDHHEDMKRHVAATVAQSAPGE